MERIIDRAAYRRDIGTTRTISKESAELAEKKIKKFLYQLLVSSLIFLFLSVARRYKVEPVLNWINVNINKRIDISKIYEYGQNKLSELGVFMNKIEMPENEIIQDEKHEIITDNSQHIESDIVQNGEAPNYEEAVEGVNQLIDDAKYIKENFELKHAMIGTVTSVFGVRESDNKIVTPYHSGIDVAANTGTNIYASIGGEVISATSDTAYGKYIMIQTDNLVTLYAHCSELKVKKGQKIKQGELIAKVGSTGWATGPHLHFEIRLDGRIVNPADVLDYSQMYEK